MAKIEVNVTVTIHIGNPTNNEYLKCSVGISEIDTEQPIPAQLQKVTEAFPLVMAEVDKQIGVKIQEAIASR